MRGARETVLTKSEMAPVMCKQTIYKTTRQVFNQGWVRGCGVKKNMSLALPEGWEEQGKIQWVGTENKVVCQLHMLGTKDLTLRKKRHESGLKLELELKFKQVPGLENQAEKKSCSGNCGRGMEACSIFRDL